MLKKKDWQTDNKQAFAIHWCHIKPGPHFRSRQHDMLVLLQIKFFFTSSVPIDLIEFCKKDTPVPNESIMKDACNQFCNTT